MERKPMSETFDEFVVRSHLTRDMSQIGETFDELSRIGETRRRSRRSNAPDHWPSVRPAVTTRRRQSTEVVSDRRDNRGRAPSHLSETGQQDRDGPVLDVMRTDICPVPS